MRRAQTPIRHSLLVASVAVFGVLSWSLRSEGASQDFAPEPVDFARDVRPILSDNCFVCHGPDGAERKAGLRLDTPEGIREALRSGHVAVEPGNPDASALIQRIESADADEQMPPPESGKSITAEEIATLRRWVEEGATWKQHWAFVPPERPEVPAASFPGWGRNGIDAFIERGIAAQGMHPSPDASRERLIRRLSFDLRGLPPSPAEVDAFLADPRPDAYEHLVDSFFASEHYGEHMARHWLDAARYGDTHGYHLDNVRSLWPWRDWVVQSFQGNQSFRDFTIEQLAGDMLPEATRDQRIATGFNRCNVTTGEGGLIAAEYLVKYAVDRANTTSTVWMGLTAGCAQCHDHKFDPLSQREYYEFYAFFNSIEEEASDRNALTPPPMMRAPSDGQEAELVAMDSDLAILEEEMAAPMPEVDRAQSAWEREEAERVTGAWRVLHPLSAISLGGAELRVLEDDSILASGTDPERDVYTIAARTDLVGITALRIEALPDPSQGGGGVGRQSHGNIVLTDVGLEALPRGKELGEGPVELVSVSADYSQIRYNIAKTLDDDAVSGWAVDGRKSPCVAVFGPAEPIGFDGGTLLRVTLRHESQHVRHNIGRVRISVSTDPALAPSVSGDWHAMGPFVAANAGKAFNDDFGPEARAAAGIDLTEVYDEQIGGWTAHPEWVDEGTHNLSGNLCATYLLREIQSPSARPLDVAFGTDDDVKLWLNGELVLENRVGRPVAADQEKLTLQLRAGTNQLLMKVVNRGGGYAFTYRAIGEDPLGLPPAVIQALAAKLKDRDEAQLVTLREHFRRNHSEAWAELERERIALKTKRDALEASFPVTMVMKERAERRPAHILARGQYDLPGEVVQPGVPAILPPLPEGREADRLALAEWLTDPAHPLTARVTVNRFWAQFFGRGLVNTPEDFGLQGAYPSHPELLDWLAREFVDGGWDVQDLVRSMVTSSAYRQASRVDPRHLELDPQNIYLARGPRYRLDAECIRDNALAVSGLLVPTIGGAPVKPYQPTGIWKAVGYTSSNTANFVQDMGDKLYRRSMYTFWKRTAAPPTMQLFDAPSRESCTVQRARTNTPLQALALQNDIQYVEAARELGARMVREGGTSFDERATYGWRLLTSRYPEVDELAVLRAVFEAQLEAYRADPESATALLSVGDSTPDPELDAPTFAAWTVLGSLLLNLDETVTKG